ncbi:FHA domain-containing protein [Amycolatopsis sp. NBC_01286]|uniref:FHA domain-containing protein n=1 Tax=Amycolatopsis sp. NBC_01286 TaxID=2903560 RepID=UPI002E0EDC5D|nr:FHA domain-containing protein [Amycolatopsis sp. NBC_01286]
MATLKYECAIDPAGCGDYAAPGFCTRHPLRPLRAIRTVVPPDHPTPRETGPEPGPAARPDVSVTLLGRTVTVAGDGLCLGREAGPFADVPDMDRHTQISREHAKIYWLGDVLYIRDCGSTNGTYVDGERVDTPRRLVPGQSLRLGLDVPVTVAAQELDEFGLPR